MRFVRIEHWDGPAYAVVVSGTAVLLDDAARAAGFKRVPERIAALTALDRPALERLEEGAREVIWSGEAAGPVDEVHGLVRSGDGTTYRLLEPVEPVRNILCVGKNYRAHVNEVAATAIGKDAPSAPVVFTKATTAVTGPGTPIPAHAAVTAELDYEGEIAVVIGRGGRGIPREAAWEHVLGLTLIDDVTARDLQRRHRQFFLGKSLDGSAPLGPAIVHRLSLPPVEEITLTTRVNGELRQRGSLADLIFPIPELIETLSAGMTLLPGDVIATGTPAGVGAGFDPPRFLRPGDVVEVASPQIGRLVNTVVD